MKAVSVYLTAAQGHIKAGRKGLALHMLHNALMMVREHYNGAARNRACGAHIVTAIVALGGRVD